MNVLKEFLIGFIFLVLLVIISGISFLFLPLVFVGAVFFRVALVVFFALFIIWLVGKIITEIWNHFNKGHDKASAKVPAEKPGFYAGGRPSVSGETDMPVSKSAEAEPPHNA